MKSCSLYRSLLCLLFAACGGSPPDQARAPAELTSQALAGALTAADERPIGAADGEFPEALGTCASGLHQCSAWGATCSGSTLRTCVFDDQGCRRLITQTCRLGCDAAAGACKSCDALSAPRRGSSVSTPTAYYGSIARKGDMAVVVWNERTGIYSSSNYGLATVDLSNPDALTTRAVLTLPKGTYVRALQFSGNRLYGLSGGRLQIWDATDLTNLKELGTYLPADAPLSLAVAGGVAYIGTRLGLDVVDVTPTTGPELLSVFATTVPAFGVAVAKHRVAVAGSSGLEIIDATDSTSLVLLAKAALPFTLYGYDPAPLAFDGTYAYVAGTYSYNSTSWTELRAAELTAANELKLRGSLRGLDNVSNLLFEGSTLVVQNREAVGTLDLTDPAVPRWKRYVWLGPKLGGVAAKGSLLFAATMDGVTAVDLSRAFDVSLQPLSNPDWLSGAVIKGAIAYIARASGLVIEDIRNPAKPVVLSRIAIPATSIALDGWLAYVSVRGEGLRIYDIRSPWKPELVGSVRTDIGDRISVAGSRAYAMCDIGRICVFDVSKPEAPALLEKSDVILRTLGYASAGSQFAMRGSRLYLPRSDKLYIIDMSTPAAPVTLGQIALNGRPGGSDAQVALTATGEHAVLAYECHSESGDHCFEVIDVSSPSLPKKVGAAKRDLGIHTNFYRTFSSGSGIASMTIAGSHLFLSNLWGGIFVMDVSNPALPKPLGDLWTALPARKTFLFERFLTSYTEASFPYPHYAEQSDQVLQLCN